MAARDVPSGTIDTSKGFELRGGNYYSNGEAIYYGNFETKSLERYVVREDYSIETTGGFDLGKYGIMYANVTPIFFSASSAYYIDTGNMQLIHFDPTAMKIKGTVKIPELEREGYSLDMIRPLRQGDRYLITAGYYDEMGAYAPDSTVVTLEDNPEHPVVAVATDERATLVIQSFLDDKGDLYGLADGYASYLPLFADTPVEPTVLHIKKGEHAFDADYKLDLGELLT